jgi:hypothetical protein
MHHEPPATALGDTLTAALVVNDTPRGTNSRSLRPLERVNVLLPPEAALPMSERVYAMDIASIDDPVAPTERDLALVERLGSLMCDPVEVIAITGLTKAQFNQNETLQGAWARGRERAKARLRLMQFDAAAMGSERMLIHLGKQYLEQTERTESKNVGDDERKERQSVRDKLADAIDRAAEKRLARGHDGRGTGALKEVVAALGEGQPTSP